MTVAWAVVGNPLLYAALPSKGFVFVAVALGSLGGVSFPAISALKSMHAAPEEQGAVQGALAGIRSLASGLGPLAFARLFRATTSSSSPDAFFPQACFLLSFSLMAAAGLVALSVALMPLPAPPHHAAHVDNRA